jgi:hypothetical protein
MPTPRSGLSVATALNGRIYSIGGYSDDAFDPFGGLLGRYHATVEEYDPAKDAWTRRADMPTARTGLGAVAAIDGLIYAIGGFSPHKVISKHDIGEAYLRAVEANDPWTDNWKAQPGMAFGRTGVAMVRIDSTPLEFELWETGKILVLGGENHEHGPVATVEEFDLVTKSWRTMAPMALARANFGAALTGTANNHVHAVGGFNSTRGHLAEVEVVGRQ